MQKIGPDLRKEFLDIIDKSHRGQAAMLDHRQVGLLFYWQRRKDDPEFSFVPAKYREAGSQRKKRVRKKRAD